MNRQRGIAMIAIYAIIALGLVASLVGWWEYHNYRVRAAEKAKWQAAVARCEENVAAAVSANKTLKDSTDKLLLDIDTQNKRIVSLQQQEAAARKARDAALAAALAKERELRAEINRLTIIANAPPVTLTPEVCLEADSLLRSYVTAR